MDTTSWLCLIFVISVIAFVFGFIFALYRSLREEKPRRVDCLNKIVQDIKRELVYLGAEH